MERCMLMLYVPPAIEESIVDWLLERELLEGFSSAEVYGHGARQTGMSLLEQVTGRQRRVLFQIETSAAVMHGLIAALREQFAGTGLHYMVVPVAEAGQM